MNIGERTTEVHMNYVVQEQTENERWVPVDSTLTHDTWDSAHEYMIQQREKHLSSRNFRIIFTQSTIESEVVEMNTAEDEDSSTKVPNYLESIRELAHEGLKFLHDDDFEEAANIVSNIRSDLEKIVQHFEIQGVPIPEYRQVSPT